MALYTAHDGTAATTLGYQALVAPGLAIARKDRDAGADPASDIVGLGRPGQLPTPGELLAGAAAADPAVLLSMSHGDGAPRAETAPADLAGDLDRPAGGRDPAVARRPAGRRRGRPASRGRSRRGWQARSVIVAVRAVPREIMCTSREDFQIPALFIHDSRPAPDRDAAMRSMLQNHKDC